MPTRPDRSRMPLPELLPVLPGLLQQHLQAAPVLLQEEEESSGECAMCTVCTGCPEREDDWECCGIVLHCCMLSLPATALSPSCTAGSCAVRGQSG